MSKALKITPKTIKTVTWENGLDMKHVQLVGTAAIAALPLDDAAKELAKIIKGFPNINELHFRAGEDIEMVQGFTPEQKKDTKVPFDDICENCQWAYDQHSPMGRACPSPLDGVKWSAVTYKAKQ